MSFESQFLSFMEALLKQFLLASVLIAVPVAAFGIVEAWVLPASNSAEAASATQSLGDLSGYQTIVSDTQTLVDSGKMGQAQTRITDFETKWDDAEKSLRPNAPAAWGNVDAAADTVFAALRAQNPDPKAAKAALANLAATLSDPAGSGGASGSAGVKTVSGVAVTDANGHAIPCETMIGEVRSALSDGSIKSADAAKAKDLQSKAMERCNADDDTHADQFSAAALALAGK